jgi:multiple sugar transport system substrate-binding protein
MIPARLSERAGAAEFPQAPIVDVIDAMHFLPPVPGLGGVQAESLEPAVANGVLGKEDPADALGSAAKKATELMERNRESFGD